MHSADYAVARCLSMRLSVCLSVCLSHASILSKRLYISSKFFSPPVSATTLVSRTKQDGNIPTGAIRKGYEVRKDVWKDYDFRLSRFIFDDFISEIMQDRDSDYGRRIGNLIQAFEWYQFDWLSVTFFKVTIIQRQITRKWYNTELYLQWFIDRGHYQWPWTTHTPVLRSCHSLTLNISETVRDT